MKRLFYIFCATVLGLLLGWWLHAVLVLSYAQLLFWRFDIFGLGLSWDSWFIIHYVFTTLLVLGGGVWGLGRGQYWWQMIYVDKRWPGILNSLRKGKHDTINHI